MPGIPGTTSSTDGIVAEVRTFIQLPKGLITMGVNSDDGFQTTAGYLADAPLLLGALDGGRSAGDTIFQFAVQEAGVYAFRTIWFEGGGDASLEWFVVNPNASRVLINDTANSGPRSYQQGTVPTAPIEDVRITITKKADGQVVLEWAAGALQSADIVTGTYQTVVGATSPYPVTAGGTQKFYRVLVR
jgi:hypothetical protein